MKLEEIRLLKIGDIVMDNVSKAEFIVTNIDKENRLPLCLQLTSEISYPIYLNYLVGTTSVYAEKGDEYWVYLNNNLAYGAYSYPTTYANRRVMTCEDLVLKSTAPWIKPTEEVKVEQSDYLISLSELVKLTDERFKEDLTTINQLIQQRHWVNKKVVIYQKQLKNKVDDKALVSKVREKGYTVNIGDDRLVISGW